MKLTSVLFRWRKPTPKGHLFRGKYRLVKEVTALDVAKKRKEFEIEEKNMFYLRHPYLTLEQAHGHAKSFNHREKYFGKHLEIKLNKWEKHKLLGDRFGFLKVSDKWE